MDKERYTVALIDAIYDAGVVVEWSKNWNPNYFQLVGKSMPGKEISCWCEINNHQARITFIEQNTNREHYIVDLADPYSIDQIIKIFKKANK